MSRLLKYWELPIVMGVNEYDDDSWIIKEEEKEEKDYNKLECKKYKIKKYYETN